MSAEQVELNPKEQIDKALADFDHGVQAQTLLNAIHEWQLYLHEAGDNATQEQVNTLAALREKLSEVLI